MEAIEINLSYPFWVNRSFLIHTETADHRFRFLGYWIEQLNDLQKPDCTISLPISDKSLSILKSFDWELRTDQSTTLPGNSKKYKNSVGKFNSRYLPVNLNKEKLGVLSGILSFEKEGDQFRINKSQEPNFKQHEVMEAKSETKVTLNIPEEAEAKAKREAEERKKRDVEHCESLLSMLQAFFGEACGKKWLQSLESISVEIHFYDWNIGVIDISYIMKNYEWDQDDAKNLKQTITSLQQIYLKTISIRAKSADEKLPLDDFFNKNTFLEEFKDSNEENKKSPSFRFWEELILGFALVLDKDCLLDDSKKNSHKEYSIVPGFFDNPIEEFMKKEPKQGLTNHTVPIQQPDVFDKSKAKKTSRRMPFYASRIIFYSSNLDFVEKTLKEDIILKVIESNKTFFSKVIPDPIYKVESGFDLSLAIVKINENDSAEELIKHEIVRRLKWFWKLGIIYFSGIHRIQNELIIRMNRSLQWSSYLKDEINNASKANSHELDNRLNDLIDAIHQEKNKLRNIDLAVGIATQEFESTLVCDTTFYRDLHTKINEDYNIERLFKTVKEPIKLMIDEWNSVIALDDARIKARNDKIRDKNEKSLEGLKYVTLLSIGLTAALITNSFWKILEDYINLKCAVPDYLYLIFYIATALIIPIAIFRLNRRIFIRENEKQEKSWIILVIKCMLFAPFKKKNLPPKREEN